MTPHLDKFVGRAVASGRYQNASEIIREGLRLVQQRDAENGKRLALLQAAVRKGDEDIAAGRSKAFKGSALKRYLRDLSISALAEAKRSRGR